jgi:hypothetical protein
LDQASPNVLDLLGGDDDTNNDDGTDDDIQNDPNDNQMQFLNDQHLNNSINFEGFNIFF